MLLRIKKFFSKIRVRIQPTGGLAIAFLVSIFILGIVNVPQLIKVSYTSLVEGQGTMKERLSGIQTSFSENLKLKNAFVNLNGLVHLAMGQREMNGVVKLSDNTLFSVSGPSDTSMAAAMCTQFNQKLKERGIPFLYVGAPNELSGSSSAELPIGICDYSNQSCNTFMSQLQSEGVLTLDLRVAAINQKMDFSSMFFKTDHHWTPETGFWAFKEIVTAIEDNVTSDARSILDETKYTYTKYDKCLLGSHGRRTGQFYAGLDDLTIIEPTFPTDMSVEFLSGEGEVLQSFSGTFRDVMYDWEKLNNKDIFNTEMYTVYGFGYPAIALYKNENAPSSERIIVVSDSFGQVVKPFLSLYYQEVIAVNLIDNHTHSLMEYVEKAEPDKVVVLYSSSIFNRGEAPFYFF